MLPRQSKNYLGYGSLVYPVAFSYLSLREFLFFPESANHSNLFGGDDVVISSFSSRIFSTSLRYTIPPVIQIFSNKKMIRIAAWRIVAFVQNIKAVRNRTVDKCPRHAVRFTQFSPVPRDAVAAAIDRLSPCPAVTFLDSFIKKSPEPFPWRQEFSMRVTVALRSAVVHLAETLRRAGWLLAIIDRAFCHEQLFTMNGSNMQVARW